MILFSNRKIQTSDDYLKEYIMCQYYDEKAEMQDRNEGRMSEPGASVCSLPLTQRATSLYPPVQRKFHYKFNDGSSFILYLNFFFKLKSCGGNVSLQLTS